MSALRGNMTSTFWMTAQEAEDEIKRRESVLKPRVTLETASAFANEIGLTMTAKKIASGSPVALDLCGRIVKSCLDLTDKSRTEKRAQYAKLGRMIRSLRGKA